MRTIEASKFQAKCADLMREVEASGEGVVITRDGLPICRLVPFQEKARSLYGLHRDSVAVEGDVVSPLNVEWDAAR